MDGFAYSSPVIYRILLGLNDPVSTSQAVTSALATATATAVALAMHRRWIELAVLPLTLGVLRVLRGRCTQPRTSPFLRSSLLGPVVTAPQGVLQPFSRLFGREHGRGVPRRRSGPGSASFLSEFWLL